VNGRSLTWLATAAYALAPNKTVTVVYFTAGVTT
jgi:hypothetical protein